MDLDRGGCLWPTAMIGENAETLNHLCLGSATRIAQDFALKRRPQYDRLSASFTADVKDKVSALS